jgi:hypothetical protein
MVKKFLAGLLILIVNSVGAQTLINQGSYDSTSLVDTNSTSVSASTVNTNNTSNSTSTATSNSTVNSVNANTNISTSTNTNNNIQSGTVTNNNNNVNSGTMTYNNNNVNSGDVTNRNINTATSTNTNNNINSGTMTYNNNNVSTNVNTGDMTNRNINTSTNNNVQTGDMTNRNINTSNSSATNVNQNTSTANNVNQNVQTGDMTNRNINESTITQRIIQPPPTAVAPAMLSGGNPDLCSTGSSGSVQTQVFGVSSGGTVRDLNCERLKLSKTLYDMGMKVAAVATMCQDRRVFDAMMSAGTPCPVDGMIGVQARSYWDANPTKVPKLDEVKQDDTYKKIGIGALLGILVHKLF